MDTSNRKTIFEGPLPVTAILRPFQTCVLLMLVTCPQISAGSTLTWIGFGENGMLLTMDSAGLFRLHSRMWEGRWTPVLDTAAKAGAGSRSDVYWPVAVADNGVLCAVLKVRVGQAGTLLSLLILTLLFGLPLLLSLRAVRSSLRRCRSPFRAWCRWSCLCWARRRAARRSG